MNVPLVYHPEYYCDIGPHVFPTEKFGLIYKGLKEQIENLDDYINTPELATREQLLRVHTPEY